MSGKGERISCFRVDDFDLKLEKGKSMTKCSFSLSMYCGCSNPYRQSSV